MVDPRLQEIKILVIGEISSWESITQSSGSLEESEWNILLANGI